MVDKAAQGQMRIEYRGDGEKAGCPPNPRYPLGVDVDLSKGAIIACKSELPYPAPGIGAYVVECTRCGMTVAITCAGRVDDPRSVTLQCKNTNSSSARH